MSDYDRDSAAWRWPPLAYLSTRPAQGSVGRPHPLYVGMADGRRLAVDVYLPLAVIAKGKTMTLRTLTEALSDKIGGQNWEDHDHRRIQRVSRTDAE